MLGDRSLWCPLSGFMNSKDNLEKVLQFPRPLPFHSGEYGAPKEPFSVTLR